MKIHESNTRVNSENRKTERKETVSPNQMNQTIATEIKRSISRINSSQRNTSSRYQKQPLVVHSSTTETEYLESSCTYLRAETGHFFGKKIFVRLLFICYFFKIGIIKN